MRPTAWAMTTLLVLGLACAGSEEGDAGAEAVVSPEPEAPGEGGEPAGEPEPAIEREPLQALVVTSSAADAPNLLDGDPETRWVPQGDAAGEGVWIRFEAPHRLETLQVETCGDTVPLRLLVNGAEVGSRAGNRVTFDLPEGEAKTLSLTIPEGQEACLSEVRVEGADGPLALAPPRSVEARVEISSTLEPVALHHLSYLFDGRPHVAWEEGAKGNGEGESIQISFREDITITAIELWNGDHRSAEAYAKHTRIRKLEVEAEGRRVMFDVPEGMAPQQLELDPPVSARVLTLSVAAVTKGTASEDLVVSELRFRDRQGPFTIRPAGADDLPEKLAKRIEGKPLAKVVDKTFRELCGEEERVLKLRGDGSFTYGETVEEGDTPRRWVLDGAWAPVKREVELRGRRRRVEPTFVPNQGAEAGEGAEAVEGRVSISLLQGAGEEDTKERLQRLAKGGAAGRVSCLMEGRAVVPSKLQELAGDREVILVEGEGLTDLLLHAP